MFLVFLMMCTVMPAGASAQENENEENQIQAVSEEVAPASEKLDALLEDEQSSAQEFGESVLKQEKDVANQDYAYDAENHMLTVYTNEGTNKWRTEISGIRGTVTTLEIMKSVATIEDEAFFGCTSLKEVAIADTVENIGIRGVAYCISLKQINIPSSVKEIGKLAFSVCSTLEDIRLSEGLKYIG